MADSKQPLTEARKAATESSAAVSARRSEVGPEGGGALTLRLEGPSDFEARSGRSRGGKDARSRAGSGRTSRAFGDTALVFPLERTVVELRVERTVERLDRATFGVVPAGVRHEVAPLSPLARVATLLVHPRARDEACRQYAPHVVPERLAKVLGTPLVLIRTRWVDEIVHRYVFEIDTCKKHGSQAACFLETEIVKEAYFLGQERLGDRARASVVHEGSDLVGRARTWLEEHLFEALRVDALARACRTSESTLLRAFRREVGTTPSAYVRDRRLDEALLWLRAGRFGVSEVATRIGYASVSAFTVAFRRRFGVPPSTVQRGLSPTPSLAPHGDPPKT